MDANRIAAHRAGVFRLCVLGMSFLLLFEFAWPEGTGAYAQSPEGEVGYARELEKGRSLMRQRKYEEALKSFKRANEMRDKKSAECFFWMAQAYQGLGAYKNVVESCEKGIQLAEGDVSLRARLYNLQGMGLQSQSEGKDQKKLQQAESAFQSALALSVGPPTVLYNLGFVLLQQNRDPEGIARLKEYLEAQPSGPNADAARKMIDNPRRAREPYAPEFSITTLEREYISLEDLQGKVVLLDFWGTWCPPCVASVPSLRELYKRHATDSSFVMIGISTDSDEWKWRSFVEKNQMAWRQYLDRDRRVTHAFGINAFPTYIVIDPEGIVRYRSSGAGVEREADLENALKKQLKLATKKSASE